MSRTLSRGDDRSGEWLTVAIVLGGLLLLFYVVPLLSLLVAQPPGQIIAHLADPEVVRATINSIISALTSTALASTLGLPLAYWLARTEFRFRNAVAALVVLPLVLPPIVSGMVLLTVVGPNTLVGQVAGTLGFTLTRSLVGVVLAQTFVASPFVVVTAIAAFDGVDRTLESASLTLGKPRSTTFRRITLPLAWPGILAGMILAFARAMGEFGATVMLAYYPRTMPVQIWISFTTLGLENAFPVAVILVAVSIGVLVVLDAIGANPWR